MSEETIPLTGLTEEQLKELRAIGIRGLCQHFIEALKSLGVNTMILGVSLDDSPGGEGIYTPIGDATIVLNLVGAIMKTLRPEDFHNMLLAMQSSPYFAESRGEMIQPPTGRPN